jgi:hypothetical protein
MTWVKRIPHVLWRLGALTFLLSGTLLPLVAWRFDLPRLLPASLIGPAMALGLVSTVSWLGVGSYCLARSRLHAHLR